MSNRNLFSKLTNISSSGQLVGGVHKISGTYHDIEYEYTMLDKGAWRGGNVYYYKQTKMQIPV